MQLLHIKVDWNPLKNVNTIRMVVERGSKELFNNYRRSKFPYIRVLLSLLPCHQ